MQIMMNEIEGQVEFRTCEINNYLALPKIIFILCLLIDNNMISMNFSPSLIIIFMYQ